MNISLDFFVCFTKEINEGEKKVQKTKQTKNTL